MSFVGIFWIKTCCFSDDDFVTPKKNKEAQEQPAHPILGHGSFPNFEAPLCEIEDFMTRKRQKTIGALCRKVIKAVRPGVRGKGANLHWGKSVRTEALTTKIANALVENKVEFSLADFLPWSKMHLKDFNSGPTKKDFLIPVKSWDHFQVLFLKFMNDDFVIQILIFSVLDH